MRYPIAIESGSNTTAYGVIVPDLPGCNSAGDTIDEAMVSTEEAVVLWLEDAAGEGAMPPKPSLIEHLRAKEEYAGWTWAIINVDLFRPTDNAGRVDTP